MSKEELKELLKGRLTFENETLTVKDSDGRNWMVNGIKVIFDGELVKEVIPDFPENTTIIKRWI